MVSLGVALLNANHGIWERTSLPRLVGGALHDLDRAREDAAASASLLAAALAVSLVVPVVGVPPGEVADTFGAPRGTDRKHEGVDIFAARGTYVTSATEGVVVRIGTNGLGGNVVYVLGPGGERYYYAHLDEVDPVLTVGQHVGTSTVLGRVGTTGNAAGTPPHLHFGIYGQGGTKNPYERF